MNNLNKMSFSVTRYVTYNMFQMENMKHPYLNCPASCNKLWELKQTDKQNRNKKARLLLSGDMIYKESPKKPTKN